MKIIRNPEDFVINGFGSVRLEADDLDDLCYAYNLIAPGDSVMAVTTIRFQRGSERVILMMQLEVQVEVVEYDKDGSVLRVSGTNITENGHVMIGAFHTLEIELQQAFILRKQVWDSLAFDTLKQASNIAVVLMQEGLGHVFLVGPSVTRHRARIIVYGYESACGNDFVLKKFFEHVVKALVKHVDFTVVRCVVIASPGITKFQFRSHLMWEAERRQFRPIIENKSRIIVAHASSGDTHSLGEVLNAPNVMKLSKRD